MEKFNRLNKISLKNRLNKISLKNIFPDQIKKLQQLKIFHQIVLDRREIPIAYINCLYTRHT